jgi:Fe-S-cluster containining protein
LTPDTKSPKKKKKRKALTVLYDCLKCPSYCCTYPRIVVTKPDIVRLARHFGISAEAAERRFTKRGSSKREKVLRHQLDKHFGSACRFLDLDTRLCTVHASRPEVCRGYPASKSCGYYTFLQAERRDQEDPEFIARAYNLPEDWKRL